MLKQFNGSFWNISRTIKIKGPAAKVWDAITSPGSLESCHPFVESNPVQEWPGVGSKDIIHYYSGLTYYREFIAWEEGKCYDLLIGKEGSLDYTVSWRVESRGEEISTLTITVHSPEMRWWKKLMYFFPTLKYFRPLMKEYLDSVIGGYDYFITSGQPVPRNHFGAIKVFSPPVE